MHQSGYQEVLEPERALESIFGVRGIIDQLYSLESTSGAAYKVWTCRQCSHDMTDQAQFCRGLAENSSSSLEVNSTQFAIPPETYEDKKEHPLLHKLQGILSRGNHMLSNVAYDLEEKVMKESLKAIRKLRDASRDTRSTHGDSRSMGPEKITYRQTFFAPVEVSKK